MIEVYRVPSENNKIVMRMTENNRVLSEASAEIKEGTAVLEYINEYESNVAYGMGKSILNAIDLAGIKTVICENKNLVNLLKILGFKEENNVYLLNLTNYFTTDCKSL